MSFNTPEQQARWMVSAARADAESMLHRFELAHARAARAAFWARLRRRPSGLLRLEGLLGGASLAGSRAGGLRSVPIALIVASEGRADDFDARFRPLSERAWPRWRSVAAAMLAGEALPPVELLEVAGRYAVRDGHHRISAAAALGQRAVDALVTVLDLAPAPAPLCDGAPAGAS